MENKAAGGRSAGAKRGSGNALVYLGTALLTLATVVIVGLIIAASANSDVKRIHVADRSVTLTDAQAKGRELFGPTCGQCHVLAAAKTSGDVGPNLDELKPDRALVANAIEHGRTSERGTMPANLLRGEELEQVADFVAAAAGGARQ